MVWSTARAAKPLVTAASSAAASSSRSFTASMSSSASTASSSTYTIRAVAAFSRNLLHYGCRSVTVRGLDRFLALLQSSTRSSGLLTYCNHISVLDEPTLWGSLPASTFRNPRTVRWTLGASDIMFTNPLLSRFFRNGQCIETHRGGGVYQPAIDEAITKLNEGNWVHLFPEGYVNVSQSTRLRRFKWGISRMVLEAEKMPEVVPIWITGFDKMMPEPRSKPKWLPRFGNDVTITFGEPITDSLTPVVEAIRVSGEVAPLNLLPEALRQDSTDSIAQKKEGSDRSVPSQVATQWNTHLTGLAAARSQLASLLRHHHSLVGVQQRRAAGHPNPKEEGTLIHTESLRPAAQHPHNNVLDDGERKKTGV